MDAQNGAFRFSIERKNETLGYYTDYNSTNNHKTQLNL